jgi:hypothetical protein
MNEEAGGKPAASSLQPAGFWQWGARSPASIVPARAATVIATMLHARTPVVSGRGVDRLA